jgi:Holliday junction resolvasome RuvABC endonuclease subunit
MFPDGEGTDQLILALDLGTHTGWAIAESDSISSGSQSFQPKRFEGGGMRFLKFKRWLSELKGEGTLVTVYFEEVRRHMGVDAAHCYGGFLAVMTAWCEAREIPYQGVPVGTIKKFFTGKGNADKTAMVSEARRRGHRVTDDNEADALALLMWALNELKVEGEISFAKIASIVVLTDELNR